jgi:hypothetical protein
MRNGSFSSLLFLSAFFVLPFESLAWGERGHQIVAQMAKQALDPAVRDSVQFYLGKMSFKEASVWMDKIKRDKTFVHMRGWHYVNLEKDEDFSKVAAEENVVTQLEKAIHFLLTDSRKEKNKVTLQLRILFHLIGDIHQPLHCGYGSDKGGNKEDVDFMGTSTNLHRVWDTDLIVKGRIGMKTCYEYANSLSEKEKRSFCNTRVKEWMNESRALLPSVYKYENKLLGQEYLDEHSVVVKRQLVKAGIRLAYILNEAFRKK